MKDPELLTESEKIDAIYRMLRSQRRYALISSILSWTVRLVIIGTIWYGYQRIVVEGDTTLQDKIQSFVVKQVSSLIGPIVGDVIKGNPDLLPPGVNLPSEAPFLSGASVTSTPSQSTTPARRNVPKTRPVDELLKDEALMKTATDIYKQKTGQ